MADTVADTPKLRELWDAEKNSAAANEVPARNFRSAWWKCSRGHSFQRAPRLMLRDATCPTCGVASTSFATEHPRLAKLWHPTKNGDLRPDAVDSRHAADAWWRCERGHAFRRPPLQMPHDSSCPTCALAEESLTARFPAIAAEWHPERNGDITPDQVDADHQMNAWWRCERGHEFQATVRSRCRGNRRCPVCFGAWSVEHLRGFVKALLGHVDALNPSEMYALAMQAGALRNRESKAFVMALTSGRFPPGELEKFAEGEPSLLDEYADKKALELELVDARQAPQKPSDPRYELPAAPVTADQDAANVDIDVSQEVDLTTRTDDDGNELPVIQTRDALAALDSALVANADAETVKFLLDSAKAKLWRHAYSDAAQARAQAAGFKGDVFSSSVRDNFLGELDAAENLALPPGYSFQPTPDSEITKPLLMQQHVAVSVRNSRRFGNWSGMGAGKTLSAVLATRVVAASLTVICCPNAVVDNWEAEVQNAFPQCEVAKKTWTPDWKHPLADAPRYLVMNYEQFQQPNSEEKLVAFLERNVVDFIVIDEIHYAKQRDAGTSMSRRKKLVQGLVLESGKKNADLCVLGMSGTPVINTLQEGKSLVEMITGHRHDDLETRATVQNCMRLYQRLVTLGTRYKPPYHMQLDESSRPEVDCGPFLDEIREVGRGSVLKLEQVLTRVRLPAILEHLRHGEKAIIYTHYVDGIADQLRGAIAAAGFRVGLLIGGVDRSALDEFKKPNGTVDVLVASSRIATGVDGLQHVCNKLIINALPWTNAEYEQLRGRLWRQGSKFDKVTVVIPVTYAIVNGQRWSYCESKLDRLEYKKSIADAAVDGVVPEGNLRTPTQAQQDIMNWLSRLESGEIQEVVRPEIKIPLSGEPSEVKRRVSTYGDFSRVNNRWYASSSKLTHARLAANPEEWAHYHTLYRDARESWPVVPFKEEMRWLSEREGLVVGDFGCGEALLAQAIADRHQVHSFDHVALHDGVVACDIASVPLDDGVLDVAIFCLSLMGSNFTDYIREAHRCLRLDARLHIWEAASYFDDLEGFCAGLGRLGFDVLRRTTEGGFVCIQALKNTTVPAPALVLPFRGNGG
jgi:hypothetical protein